MPGLWEILFWPENNHGHSVFGRKTTVNISISPKTAGLETSPGRRTFKPSSSVPRPMYKEGETSSTPHSLRSGVNAATEWCMDIDGLTYGEHGVLKCHGQRLHAFLCVFRGDVASTPYFSFTLVSLFGSAVDRRNIPQQNPHYIYDNHAPRKREWLFNTVLPV